MFQPIGKSDYGYTDEYQEGYNDLVYLRARHYAPSTGRFLTRDTWAGDANHPLSFNRWNYTFSNPVNLTDPSGYFPPFWCQKMTSEAAYEKCVGDYYKIEPIDKSNYGQFVTKNSISLVIFDNHFPICQIYKGPTEYRAPGYIEGIGLNVPLFISQFYALESVYDFATMEHGYFLSKNLLQLKPGGGGISDFVLGVAFSKYAGTVWGLRTDRFIKDVYPGPALVGSLGISAGIGIGGEVIGASIGVGMNGFISTQDPNVRGATIYVSGSIGIDIGPSANFGVFSIGPDGTVGVIAMEDLGTTTSYLADRSLFGSILTGKRKYLDESRLYKDILLGKRGFDTHWVSRVYGLGMAMYYAKVYKELH